MSVAVAIENEICYTPDDLLSMPDGKIYELVYPESRTVTIYRADGSVSRLRQDDVLSGEDVIPGFRCEVRSLFPPSAQSEGPTTDQSA